MLDVHIHTVYENFSVPCNKLFNHVNLVHQACWYSCNILDLNSGGS